MRTSDGTRHQKEAHVIRRAHAWAAAMAMFTLSATSLAQTSVPSVRVEPRADEQTLTVRRLPRPLLPPLNDATIPTIAPVTLGVPAISPPGPSTFSACPNSRDALQVPGVDCR